MGGCGGTRRPGPEQTGEIQLGSRVHQRQRWRVHHVLPRRGSPRQPQCWTSAPGLWSHCPPGAVQTHTPQGSRNLGVHACWTVSTNMYAPPASPACWVFPSLPHTAFWLLTSPYPFGMLIWPPPKTGGHLPPPTPASFSLLQLMICLPCPMAFC